MWKTKLTKTFWFQLLFLKHLSNEQSCLTLKRVSYFKFHVKIQHVVEALKHEVNLPRGKAVISKKLIFEARTQQQHPVLFFMQYRLWSKYLPRFLLTFIRLTQLQWFLHQMDGSPQVWCMCEFLRVNLNVVDILSKQKAAIAGSR